MAVNEIWGGLTPIGSLTATVRIPGASAAGVGGYLTADQLVYKQANNSYYCGGNLGIGETAPTVPLVIKGTSAGDGSAPVAMEISDTQNLPNTWTAYAAFAALNFRSADGSVTGVGIKARIAAVMGTITGGPVALRFTVSNATLLDKSVLLDYTGHFRPDADNSQALGFTSFRWSVVYAGTGTINTSDARDKQWRGAMTTAELSAAKRIAAELGFYKWLAVIAAKGEAAARLHFGVRAQVVWEIMADEGLVDPLDGDGRPGATPYAFLCWDEWEDAEGDLTSRFGLRLDQLALFLLAAQEQRLLLLEAAMGGGA